MMGIGLVVVRDLEVARGTWGRLRVGFSSSFFVILILLLFVTFVF